MRPMTFTRAKWLLCALLGLTGIQGQLVAQSDFYDPEHIVEIRIEFDRPDWDEVLDSLKRDKVRLPATVTIDGQVFERVGVRYKGNSSYNSVRKHGGKKLPFNIEADFERKGQRFPGGVETIKLSNSFRDPSFLREILSYEIAGKYMPAPRCNFARVWVNGEYLGLYHNTQSVDKGFLDAWFGTHKGTFVKCDPEWWKERPEHCPEGDGKASLMYLGEEPACYDGLYELKSKKGWGDLIRLVRVLNKSPQHVDTLLNVDAALWMLAFNSVLVNLDSYTGRLSHNYYLFETPDGLMTPLVWDMNLSFGGFRFDGLRKRPLTNEELQTLSPFLHYKTKNPARPLIVKLLANPLYRKVYLGHVWTILQDNFANGWYVNRAEQIRQLIREEVQADPHRLYDYEAFERNLDTTVMAGRSAIIGIRELMEARTRYLLAHPLFRIPPPSVDLVRPLVFDDSVIINAESKDAEGMWLVWRRDPTDRWHYVQMFDDGAHADEMPGDHVWGVSVEGVSAMQYYLIAEGPRMAITWPAGGAFGFVEVE